MTTDTAGSHIEEHPRWRRMPDQRPQQILRAASEVFADRGFRAATMEEIAEAARITKGTIYLYFSSKEELFLSMLRSQFQRLLDLLPQIALSPEENLEELARCLGMAFLKVMMTPEVARLIPLVVSEMKNLPAMRDLYRNEIIPKANMELARFLEQGMEAGMLRRMDPVIAARALFGMFMVFVVTQEVFGAREVTPMKLEDIVDTVVAIYFHGISATGEK